MIKGINKQIIEIRCTNDEFFEKALLFVRADKASEPRELIERCAHDYCRSITPRRERGRGGKRAAVLLLGGLVLAAAAALIVIAAA